ncbi:hypothetical protein D3C77_732260 [compost metagenome]
MVDAIKSSWIDLQHFQRFFGNFRRDNAVALHLRIVADPFQQTVRNPGRSP